MKNALSNLEFLEVLKHYVFLVNKPPQHTRQLSFVLF